MRRRIEMDARLHRGPGRPSSRSHVGRGRLLRNLPRRSPRHASRTHSRPTLKALPFAGQPRRQLPQCWVHPLLLRRALAWPLAGHPHRTRGLPLTSFLAIALYLLFLLSSVLPFAAARRSPCRCRVRQREGPYPDRLPHLLLNYVHVHRLLCRLRGRRRRLRRLHLLRGPSSATASRSARRDRFALRSAPAAAVSLPPFGAVVWMRGASTTREAICKPRARHCCSSISRSPRTSPPCIGSFFTRACVSSTWRRPAERVRGHARRPSEACAVEGRRPFGLMTIRWVFRTWPPVFRAKQHEWPQRTPSTGCASTSQRASSPATCLGA